jgi:hypothetical protein
MPTKGWSKAIARHDTTRRSGLSATGRNCGRGYALDIAAPHRLRMPPHFKIRSPRRIVSLQHLHDQIELKSLSIEASRCGDIDTILREPYKVCFKYIEGHAVLHSSKTVARVVKFENPAKPLVHCERWCSRNSAGLLSSFVAVHESFAAEEA